MRRGEILASLVVVGKVRSDQSLVRLAEKVKGMRLVPILL
jgi:hypothetical protein